MCVIKKKIINISLFIGFLALVLALLLLPDFGEPRTISGTYIGQSGNYIKLYRSRPQYYYIDISKLDALPEMYTGDSIVVEYRVGGAFELYDGYDDHLDNIVATGLRVLPHWGSIYFNLTDVTPTAAQLQMGVTNKNIRNLTISKSFLLLKQTEGGFQELTPLIEQSPSTEWIPFYDGGTAEFSWESLYGTLGSGTYRMHVTMRYSNGEELDYHKEFTIP